MTKHTLPDPDRLDELLVDRALNGLTDEDDRALRAMLAKEADDAPAWSDRTVAVMDIAWARLDDDPVPAALREKLLASGRAWQRARAGRERRDDAHAAPRRDGVGNRMLSPRGMSNAMRFAAWSGWLAAAACLMIALLLWQRPAVIDIDEAPLRSPAEARRALLDEAPDVMRLGWVATDDPAAAGARGDVTWSTARQEGYLRLRGLQPNDPSRVQYQLWIFDSERPEQTPVDGGVFDVPHDAEEVVIPVHAKLRVFEPAMFAVTIEPPGGVVVSDRERLPLIAEVKQCRSSADE